MCQKNLSLTHPEYHSSRARKGSLQVEMEPVVSVRERVEQMEWRESGGRQVESVGERRTSAKSGESGVSGCRSSKVESKEIGGVSGASLESGGASGKSGVDSKVERKESVGGSGESRCLSGLKCRPNSLLSLSHPKFSKAKQARRPSRKLNLYKQSESQMAANLNFWEKWGVVKMRSNTTLVLNRGQDISDIGVHQ